MTAERVGEHVALIVAGGEQWADGDPRPGVLRNAAFAAGGEWELGRAVRRPGGSRTRGRPVPTSEAIHTADLHVVLRAVTEPADHVTQVAAAGRPDAFLRGPLAVRFIGGGALNVAYIVGPDRCRIGVRGRAPRNGEPVRPRCDGVDAGRAQRQGLRGGRFRLGPGTGSVRSHCSNLHVVRSLNPESGEFVAPLARRPDAGDDGPVRFYSLVGAGLDVAQVVGGNGRSPHVLRGIPRNRDRAASRRRRGDVGEARHEAPRSGAGKDPRPGLLDGQRVVARDLELDLHRERLVFGGCVQLFEGGVDGFQAAAQLPQLHTGHEELAGFSLVGGVEHLRIAIQRREQQFLRYRVLLWIGDEVLADLAVDVVVRLPIRDRVEADGHAIDLLVRIVGMDQHPHGRRQVIDAVELPFAERPEVPQAGKHLLERLVDAVLDGLVRLLGVGVVQPRTVKARQVLVVGAGAVAQRLAFRETPRAWWSARLSSTAVPLRP